MNGTFGKRLRELRLESMLKQSDLAEALNVHFVTVSKWERDINEPCLADIKKLAVLLDVTLDTLLDYDPYDYAIEYRNNKISIVYKENDKTGTI